jgi:hypothetical protein
MREGVVREVVAQATRRSIREATDEVFMWRRNKGGSKRYLAAATSPIVQSSDSLRTRALRA